MTSALPLIATVAWTFKIGSSVPFPDLCAAANGISVNHLVGTRERRRKLKSRPYGRDLSCAPAQYPTGIGLAHDELQYRMHGTAQSSHRARNVDNQYRTQIGIFVDQLVVP